MKTMHKIAGCALLSAALSVTAVLPTAPAQTLEIQREVEKKLHAARDKQVGVIEIKEGKDGKFRFFIRDAEENLLATSGANGFASAEDADKAVARLREVIGKAKVMKK